VKEQGGVLDGALQEEKAGQRVQSVPIGTSLDGDPLQGQLMVNKGARWYTRPGCYREYRQG